MIGTAAAHFAPKISGIATGATSANPQSTGSMTDTSSSDSTRK